jgi:hypothetical protein
LLCPTMGGDTVADIAIDITDGVVGS